MRLTEIFPDPIPPPPKYRLELTEEELVALGLLSYRHEIAKGMAFISMLPILIMEKALEKDMTLATKDRTATGISWVTQ